jgi:hypothetical protein
LKIGNRQSAIANQQYPGGEGGIRTHGGLSPTPVFETGALIHYATSPR